MSSNEATPQPEVALINDLPLSALFAALIWPSEQESARLFHGRGKSVAQCDFLNIDRYASVVLVTAHKAVSEPLRQAIATELMALAQQQLPGQISRIAWQHRDLPLAPTSWLIGEPQQQLVIDEAGLQFHIELGKQQNCGFFPDMRQGRQWMRENAQDKAVLNLFAYTCAFSVAAIAGGASKVVNLDMSSPALNKGRSNHQLNGQATQNVAFFAHDLFKSWGKLRRHGPFDLIVADPPSNQKGSFNAKRDYAKVVRRLPELLAPGGQVLLCLNAPELDFDFMRELIAEHAPRLQWQRILPLAANINEQEPDRGLKTVLLTLSNND